MSDWSILWCSFETKIRDYILSKNFNTDVYFDYSTEIVNSDKEFYKLDILTKNKSHDGLFIFYRTKWSNWSKEECLREVLDYIEKIDKKELMTYEFTWSKNRETERYKSHFYGYDYKEVVDKFYSLDTNTQYKIWKTELMPES